MQFTPTDFATCNPIPGMPTYVISGPWKFSAEFVEVGNGHWSLVQSQFHPVP